jgi:hypothetical protein
MSLSSNTKQPSTDLQHKIHSAKTAADTKEVTIDSKSKNGQYNDQKKNRPPNTAPTTRWSLQAAIICLFFWKNVHFSTLETHMDNSSLLKASYLLYFLSTATNEILFRRCWSPLRRKYVFIRFHRWSLF